MKYKKIFDNIIGRADVEELESIVMTLNAVSNLSPKSLIILKDSINSAFTGGTTGNKAKKEIEKTKFELASYIYF